MEIPNSVRYFQRLNEMVKELAFEMKGETMSRLIDADKVAEAIAWLNEYDFVLWHDVQECIDKVPKVEEELVKHGHWECSPNDLMGMCSRCHYPIYGRSYNGHYLLVPYNYCPNCGAKMDEK